MDYPPAKRTGEWIKGFGTEFQKVPQFDDLLKVEAKNAKTFMSLPARYMFTAERLVDATGQLRDNLEDQRRRVDAVMHDEDDDRGVPHRDLHRMRVGQPGERGVEGPAGPVGLQGPRGEVGPAGPAPNLDPLINAMERRLAEAEQRRAAQQQQQIQDQLALVHADAQRHAAVTQELARAAAALQGIPSELQALAKAKAPAQPPVDLTTMHERAAAAIAARQQSDHQQTMQFLQHHATSIATGMGTLGAGMQTMFDRLRPSKPEALIITQPPPPPPPPPSGAAIKAAATVVQRNPAKAIENAPPPPKQPAQPKGPPPAPPNPFAMGAGNAQPPAPPPEKPLKVGGVSFETAMAAAQPKAATARPKSTTKRQPKPKPKAAPPQPPPAPPIVDDRQVGQKSKVPPQPAPANYFRRRPGDTTTERSAKRVRVARRAA
jgi:hypothetical protein